MIYDERGDFSCTLFDESVMNSPIDDSYQKFAEIKEVLVKAKNKINQHSRYEHNDCSQCLCSDIDKTISKLDPRNFY